MKNKKILLLPIACMLFSCNSSLKPLEYDKEVKLNQKENYTYKEKSFREIPTDLTDSINLTYELSEDKTYYIVSDNNHEFSSNTLVIPEKYNDLPVQEIASEGFTERNWLHTVYIPKSIKKIGDGAFNGSNIKTLYFDAENVTDFNAKNWVFYPAQGQVMDVYFGKNVLKIPNRMFFPLATNPSILPNVRNVYFSSESKISSIGDYAFYRLNTITELSLPDSITSIGDYAIYECGIKELILPTKLESIGKSAFAFSELTHIKFNGDLKEINEKAFLNNESLIEVDLSNTDVKTIKGMSFSSCSKLKNLYFNVDVVAIEKEAFMDCGSLNVLVLPNNLVSIGEKAFKNCYSLEQLKLNKSLKILGNEAFSNAINVNKLVIESTHLDDLTNGNKVFDSFSNNSKNAIVIFTKDVTYIPSHLFFSSAESSKTPVIKQLILSTSIETIGDYAFFYMDINNVDYLGQKNSFNKIDIQEHNEGIKNVTMHKEEK